MDIHDKWTLPLQPCKQTCGFRVKRKSPDASHQGFVVAGTGFEPMTFGL
jgi:hypothetical protein